MRNPCDPATFVEMLKSRVGVGLQRASVGLQVLLRMVAPSIGRVGEPHCRSSRIAAWPVIADVGPEPAGLGLAVTRSEYGHGSIVGVQLAGRHHVLTHRLDQRSEQLTGGTDPSGESGAVEIDSFTGVNLRLSVEGSVIGIMWCTT
jgi:hypothetical protein